MRDWTGKRMAVAAVLALAGIAVIALCGARVAAARHTTQQTLCVHNLKFIATAMAQYAADHEGQYPDHLSELYPVYLSELDVFVCPVTLREAGGEERLGALRGTNPSDAEFDRFCSYEIVPGLTTRDGPDTVAVFERGDNHHGHGHSVLYLDGRGGWEPAAKWRGGAGTAPASTVP